MQTHYARLVQAADMLIEHGITDHAANILAFVLAQPDVHPSTYDHADALFDDLEATICPRVILDARTYAETATLQNVLAGVQALSDGA